MPVKINMKEFWEINRKCFPLDENSPRVPVSINLDGDWICEQMQLDNVLYYSDFEYQQEYRLKCSEITQKELAYSIYPDVDFGVIMDASIYGGQVNYESNATPTLKSVLQDPEEIDSFIDRMAMLNPLEQGLIPKYLEWREKISSKYGIKLTYGEGMKGCATMLGQICGVTNFLTWIASDPEQIHKLVECWIDTSIRYVKSMRKETNFFDNRKGFSFASDVAGMLSPQMYRNFIMDAEKKLYDIFAPNPDDARFYHADSHMLHQLENLKEIGVNQVNIDPYIEPRQILEKMPDVIIFGQIPPLKVLLYGTPEEVIDYAKRDIDQAGRLRQLVLTTAGSINPGTTFENLKAICYAAIEFGNC